MFENVDKFSHCGPYVDSLSLVVGRFAKSRRPIFCDSLAFITSKNEFCCHYFQQYPQISPPLLVQFLKI